MGILLPVILSLVDSAHGEHMNSKYSKYSAEIKASILILTIFGLICLSFYLGLFVVKRPISREILEEKRSFFFEHGPHGITRESDEYIWISFPSNGTISRFNLRSEEIDLSMKSPVESPWGLAYSEGNLWIADVSTGNLYCFSLLNHTLIDAIKGNWTYPSGITISGEKLWLSSLDQMKIFEINLSSKRVIRTIRFSGVFGLDFKEGFLWVATSDMRIKKIDPTNGKVLETFYSPGRLPTGICWIGDSLWVGDKGGSLKELQVIEGRYELIYTKPPSWLYVLLFIAFLPIFLSLMRKAGTKFF